MKLSEMGLLAAPQVSHGIDINKFTNFKHIGNMNGYKIEKSEIVNHTMMIKLVDDNTDICYFVGVEFKNALGNNIQVNRTWVNKEYRNKGLMTLLYKKLFMDYDYNLLSDTSISPESKSIWSKLISALPNNVFTLDIKTSNIVKLTSIDDYFKSDSLVILLKHTNTKNNQSEDFKIPKDLFQAVLKEYEV